MVDLGFLLITFFMLATSLIKPQTMEISVPSDEKVNEADQTKIKASKAITIILGEDNKVYYYFGTRENDVDPEIKLTDYSKDGIRKVLLEKNMNIFKKIQELKAMKEKNQIPNDTLVARSRVLRGSKEAPVVLIKATDASTYKNLVDILDEMLICNIGKYALVDITPYDNELVDKLIKTN
jgi:biopolymer transport protein ExbD